MALTALLARGVCEPDADEAAQTCTIRVVPYLLKVAVQTGREEAYVRSAALNAYRDLVRARKRRAEVDPACLEYEAAPVPPTPDPRVADLRALLDGDQMPANYRVAVRAMVDGEPPLTQIASERGVDVGTVHRWASRGRAWLQRRLAEDSAAGGRTEEDE